MERIVQRSELDSAALSFYHLALGWVCVCRTVASNPLGTVTTRIFGRASSSRLGQNAFSRRDSDPDAVSKLVGYALEAIPMKYSAISRIRFLLAALVPVFWVAVSAIPSRGQATAGQFVGEVTDETGAVIRDA